MGKLESKFQSNLVHDLEERYPDCVVLKNDPRHKQGFPDLTVLYKDKWAVLECKRSASEHKQPNQDKYVEKLNRMSYSAFIFPENREHILNELDRLFERGEYE